MSLERNRQADLRGAWDPGTGARAGEHLLLGVGGISRQRLQGGIFKNIVEPVNPLEEIF